MNTQPTYPDITTYRELADYLQNRLIEESIEGYHVGDCTSQDDVIAMLHSIEDDLLFLADKIKVITQDVVVGAIIQEASAHALDITPKQLIAEEPS